jgi:hypothetical protein
MPSGHDPMGAQRLSLATNAERVCAEIMLNNDPRRDGDSTQAIALWSLMIGIETLAQRDRFPSPAPRRRADAAGIGSSKKIQA